MWTEESRKMWGCAWNRHWRDPQASPNSNWRKHSLQSLPWTIRPWIHANRSQDYWFHRPCIISIKQSFCTTYLMFNIWTHTFNRTPKYSFNKLNKNLIQHALKTLQLIWTWSLLPRNWKNKLKWLLSLKVDFKLCKYVWCDFHYYKLHKQSSLPLMPGSLHILVTSFFIT